MHQHGRRVIGFSSAFSGAFARGARYVCPMVAQAALVDGAVADVVDRRVLIGGGLLIGQAGGVYLFRTPATAAAWIEKTRAVAIREAAIIAGLDPATAEAWKARKRAKLARRADLVTAAAARQADAGKRAALIEEAAVALEKWA